MPYILMPRAYHAHCAMLHVPTTLHEGQRNSLHWWQGKQGQALTCTTQRHTQRSGTCRPPCSCCTRLQHRLPVLYAAIKHTAQGVDGEGSFQTGRTGACWLGALLPQDAILRASRTAKSGAYVQKTCCSHPSHQRIAGLGRTTANTVRCTTGTFCFLWLSRKHRVLLHHIHLTVGTA